MVEKSGSPGIRYLSVSAFFAEQTDLYLRGGQPNIPRGIFADMQRFLREAHAGFRISHNLPFLPGEEVPDSGKVLPAHGLVLECYGKVIGRELEGVEAERAIQDLTHLVDSLKPGAPLLPISKVSKDVAQKYAKLKEFLMDVIRVGYEDMGAEFHGGRPKFHYF